MPEQVNKLEPSLLDRAATDEATGRGGFCYGFQSWVARESISTESWDNLSSRVANELAVAIFDFKKEQATE
jgi:hypothetical protein